MALDETRRKLEELKHQEEEKRKHKKERKGRNSETGSERGNRSPKSNAIQGSIGSFTLLFTPELLNNMLEKIWSIDNLQNDVLDAQLLTSVQKQPQNFALSLDSQKFFVKARSNVYFKISDQKRIGYQEFRQTWQQYCGPGMEVEFHPRRKEFTQLFTNRYKWRWVNEEGSPLSEGMFQMLYRMEREPKALERLFELLQESYLSLTSESDLKAYLTQMRIRIARIIKEEVLNLLQGGTQLSPQKKKMKKMNSPSSSNLKESPSDEDEDIDEYNEIDNDSDPFDDEFDDSN